MRKFIKKFLNRFYYTSALYYIIACIIIFTISCSFSSGFNFESYIAEVVITLLYSCLVAGYYILGEILYVEGYCRRSNNPIFDESCPLSEDESDRKSTAFLYGISLIGIILYIIPFITTYYLFIHA